MQDWKKTVIKVFLERPCVDWQPHSPCKISIDRYIGIKDGFSEETTGPWPIFVKTLVFSIFPEWSPLWWFKAKPINLKTPLIDTQISLFIVVVISLKNELQTTNLCHYLWLTVNYWHFIIKIPLPPLMNVMEYKNSFI